MELKDTNRGTSPLAPTNLDERDGREAGYDAYFAGEVDLYGQGRLTLTSKVCLPRECAEAGYLVAFQVSGDERGVCAVAFDGSPLDEEQASMWIELANIAASKFVTQLADAWCADIMVSPPMLATGEGADRHRYLRATLRAPLPRSAIARRYAYRSAQGRETAVRLAYLPASNGGNT